MLLDMAAILMAMRQSAPSRWATLPAGSGCWRSCAASLRRAADLLCFRVGFFDGIEHTPRVGGFSHCVCLLVHPVVNEWNVAAKFLKQLNHLRGLLFA